MRILIVEDDELLGNAMCEGLRHYKHIVDWIKDGAAGLQALNQEEFDAIILDIGLPKISGYELLEKIRNRGIDTPVLILTARELVEDRVKGLDLGADDYLIKPFDLEEVCARLRALQRRSGGGTRSTPTIHYGDITIDPASHTVTYKGEAVEIPRREFALLHKLLENTGKVLSREYLSQNLYGWEDDVDSNALEVHVHNLRKKFGTSFVRTIRGVGYLVDKNKEKE
jgi:two-component system, OmpR family, response regulator QseB